MAVTAPPARRTRVLAAGPEHVGALMALYVDLEAERAARAVDQDEQDAFGREAFVALGRAEDRLLVALAGRHTVGFVWARLRTAPYGEFPRAVTIHHVYVKPEWRRARVLRDLYLAARAWAQSLQAPVVLAVPFSKRLVAAWRRRGFRPLTVVLTDAG